MIRVLVVDDSAFMRKAISTMLGKDPDITVIDTASNGVEALEKVRSLNPDVVTLDIEMPKMDGLTALRHIMMESPRPVLMISSLTTDGAESTLKAMELGAVDFIPKQLSRVSLDIIKIEESLRSKVKAVAKRRLRPSLAPRPRKDRVEVRSRIVSKKSADQSRTLVAIGVSTGGPPAVQRLLSDLPPEFPASLVIAQHMPKAFTGPFAKRLDSVSAVHVKEAESGEPVEKGIVYIAPGGEHLRVVKQGGRLRLEVSGQPADALYKPSVNVLMESVAETAGTRALGIILTGMGNDGLDGIRRLKERGGLALAQSDRTCVVYGMPKAVIEAGLADEVVDIDDMAQSLVASLYG